jgi:LuxR family maltose regulon positive regulatory protein
VISTGLDPAVADGTRLRHSTVVASSVRLYDRWCLLPASAMPGYRGSKRMARFEATVRRGIGSSLGGGQAAGHPTADPIVVRVLMAHLLALAAVAAASFFDPSERDDAVLTTVISAAFSFLHVASAGRRLSLSTLALDASGMALFVAGTGGASSAFLFLAMATTCWAATVPHRHGGSLWAATFAIGYATLTLPGATDGAGLLATFEHVVTMVVIGVLADWIGHVDARAIALSEALASAPAGADEVAIRDGLSRALAPMEISLDVLLAASRQGLTIIQAELLAYLVLGLTNQEIADATQVSVATVRYRLTRLYRALGVQGRMAATARAHAIGLSASGLAS